MQVFLEIYTDWFVQTFHGTSRKRVLFCLFLFLGTIVKSRCVGVYRAGKIVLQGQSQRATAAIGILGKNVTVYLCDD